MVLKLFLYRTCLKLILNCLCCVITENTLKSTQVKLNFLCEPIRLGIPGQGSAFGQSDNCLGD